MASTYLNDAGVLVIDAGPLVLESTTGLGPAPAGNADTGPQGEGDSRDVRDAAGE